MNCITFEADTLSELQQKIQTWLTGNPNYIVTSASLSSCGGSAYLSNWTHALVFYKKS